jgi:hypothetical protein
MSEYQTNLVGCTDAILQEIGNQSITQKDVAMTYALAMKSAFQGADKPDWMTINRAIIDRWSMSGLKRIKKFAHAAFKK